LLVLLTFFLLSLLAVLGLLTQLDTLPALAAPDATLTVDTLVDEDDDCASGDGCSLREAIAEAASGDMIDFEVSGTIDISGNGELVQREIAERKKAEQELQC
jgi:CSLREA domain-containing protein